MPPKLTTWQQVKDVAAEHFHASQTMDHEVHGDPMPTASGSLFVESYRWKIGDNGQQEPRRYRVAHVDHTGTVRCYPFNDPGQVLETDEEGSAVAMADTIRSLPQYA